MEAIAITKEPKPVAAPIKVGKDAAKTVANQFIFEHLPDRFCAGQPRLVVFPIRTVWSIPIVLAYPKLGTIGEVGAVIVDAEMGTIAGWTPFEEVRAAAKELYETRKEEIQAPFEQFKVAWEKTKNVAVIVQKS